MDLLNFKPDLRTVLRSPLFISRIVSIIFIIIIIACIDRDGYFAGQCVFNSKGSACSFALTVASFGFIFCLAYGVVDILFLGIPQSYRKLFVIFDLGFDCFWTFIFFVLFCYMTNHWQFSDAKPEVLNQVNLNNVRTAIAFVFFSIFSWGGMSYTSYRRYKSVQNYNQFADDVTSNIHGQTTDVGGSGYIDYFNQPPVPVQTGFDASMAADDEFIAGGQHRASDTELLTS
ncbi:unnamed protein product [Hymenolepis diminuta]|uniref:MARVEL domain-containing protein n=1 Tax=Hymenolepis diminuta TaxID=6216 RepID=A0A564YC27_HYMDI|nr:unnamed protein product [Hymenolepis diminuta]